jgi:hypothetical protein
MIMMLMVIQATGVFCQGEDTYLCGDRSFPRIPSKGVPLAQIFDSKIIDADVFRQHANKVYYIWGAHSSRQPAGVIASRYFPSMRNPEKERTIEWYKENHPDWIMYQEDRVTPAYGFVYSYGGLVPLDISNPEVQQFYLDTFIMPYVRQGYRMVAMDNVELGNWPKSVGHYHKGQWEQLYTGKKDDTAFHRSIINWMQFLSSHLHPQGVRVAANIKANTASPEVIIKVMNVVDLWLDETGFTHTGKNITDKAWERSFALLQQLTPAKAYVSINQVNGAVDSADAAQIEWVTGNFLLSRGPQSMLALTAFRNNKAEYHVFNYRKELDVDIGYPLSAAQQHEFGAWKREFSKGIVIVNPSSTKTAIVSLSNGKWKKMNGSIVENQVALSPGTAVILQIIDN